MFDGYGFDSEHKNLNTFCNYAHEYEAVQRRLPCFEVKCKWKTDVKQFSFLDESKGNEKISEESGNEIGGGVKQEAK